MALRLSVRDFLDGGGRGAAAGILQVEEVAVKFWGRGPFKPVTWRTAVYIAIGLSLVWTIPSLFIPTAMYSDAGEGFMTWRGFLQGAPFDHALQPDPANILNDIAPSYGWWSPGQYLFPGVLALAGLPLGIAITIVVGVSLLVGLLGWVRLIEYFKFPPAVGVLTVLFVGASRYTTLGFGIYPGGEVLLQAATPWIMLAACRLPKRGVAYAFAVAVSVVLIAFFVKLSGLIVAFAALSAGSAVWLARMRRITPGMIGGALGAAAAIALLYVFWFSHQVNTHFAEGTFPFTLAHVALTASAPWTAGVALQDLLRWLFLNPSRPIFSDDAPIIMLFMLPVAGLLAAFIAFNDRVAAVDRDFKAFVVVFSTLFAATMMFLYLRHSPLPLDERHFRPVGILILIWTAAICLIPGGWRPARYSVLAFCSLFCVYGIVSFVQRAAIARADDVDPFSRTRQIIVDRQSIEMLQQAYAKWGHDAVFVVPSPDITVTLPLGARVLNTSIDFATESQLADARYAGRAKGPIYVMIQTSLVATRKGELLMRSFTGYDRDKWQVRTFPKTTVFFQGEKP